MLVEEELDGRFVGGFRWHGVSLIDPAINERGHERFVHSKYNGSGRTYLMTMDFETIRYNVQDKVAEITLDQPERRNPLSAPTVKELHLVFERAAEDDDIHCILLKGEGESFSAGGDLEEFSEQINRDAIEVYSQDRTTTEFFKLLNSFEKPIIGAINGDAIAGGCGLAASCHVSVIPKNAKIGTTEIEIGIFPMLILPPLRSRIGEQKTLKLALTADRLPADEAADIGLVDEVVSPGESVNRARKIAHGIANKSPFAVQLGLHIDELTRGMPVEKQMDLMNSYRALFFQSHDLNEGARAFLEGEEPDWEGR